MTSILSRFGPRPQAQKAPRRLVHVGVVGDVDVIHRGEHLPARQMDPVGGLARKLGLSTISGPRGTALRLEDQLSRLLSMRLDWQTNVGLHPTSSGTGFIVAAGPSWLKPARQLLSRRPSWRSHIVLGPDFFKEITHFSGPIGPSGPPPAQGFPLRDGSLHLAHLPDELSQETDGGPVAECLYSG